MSFCDVLDRYEMRDRFYQKTYNQNPGMTQRSRSGKEGRQNEK